MINLEELKAKAEAAESAQNERPYLANMESTSFNQLRLHAHQHKQLDTMFALHAVCTPQAILELIARLEGYRSALKGLHDNVAEYQRINNLGAHNNHWMKEAREALKDTP